MASVNEESYGLMTIREAKTISSVSFPGVSGDELNRCPTYNEFTANGFTILSSDSTYNNKCPRKWQVYGYRGAGKVFYVLTNVNWYRSDSATPITSSAAYYHIKADGSNYVYVTATCECRQYVSQTSSNYNTIWSSGVTLDLVKESGSSEVYISNNEIHGQNRTNQAGPVRSAVFYGVYNDSRYGASATTNTFEVKQQSNTENEYNITQSFEFSDLQTYSSGSVKRVNPNNSYALVTCDAGDYQIIGIRNYKQWFTYTSGYSTEDSPVYGNEQVVANYYLLNTLPDWINLRDEDQENLYFIVKYNSQASNRTANTITFGYKLGDKHDTNVVYCETNLTLEQYRKSYTTYEGRVENVTFSRTDWDASQYDLGYAAYITAECQYRTTTWKDGVETHTNWIDYNIDQKPSGQGYPMLFSIDAENHFVFYDEATGEAVDEIELDYEYSPQYGRAIVYPSTRNDTGRAISQDVQISFLNVLEKIGTLTHNAT